MLVYLLISRLICLYKNYYDYTYYSLYMNLYYQKLMCYDGSYSPSLYNELMHRLIMFSFYCIFFTYSYLMIISLSHSMMINLHLLHVFYIPCFLAFLFYFFLISYFWQSTLITYNKKLLILFIKPFYY